MLVTAENDQVDRVALGDFIEYLDDVAAFLAEINDFTFDARAALIQ